jgi:4-diphosphocytidyl-2C-methyl-D-erythritol kinase
VPWGAGLGGGSSDAATTLLALNRLWGLHWPRERLQAIAIGLGADVPFFVGGRNAFVEGIGEQLHPLPEATACAGAGGGQARAGHRHTAILWQPAAWFGHRTCYSHGL